jgi:hypothetical protein
MNVEISMVCVCVCVVSEYERRANDSDMSFDYADCIMLAASLLALKIASCLSARTS